MAVSQLNNYLDKYMKGDYTNEELAKAVFRENGEKSIYTAFHEITQIHSARKIYDSTDKSVDDALLSTYPYLEYPVLDGKVKIGEIDIFYNNQMWEVKPLRSLLVKKDAERQLQKYEKYVDFDRGFQFDQPLDDIHVLDDLYMKIESSDVGKIGYSFHFYYYGERIDVQTEQALEYVDEILFPDSDRSKRRKKKKGYF